MTIWLLDANEGGWIIDRFNEEYMKHNKDAKYLRGQQTESNLSGQILWIIPYWCANQIPMNVIGAMKTIISCQHFVPEKITEADRTLYKSLDANKVVFHVPCEITKRQLIELFGIKEEKIIVFPFWINDNLFYPILDKMKLRDELNLPKDKFLVFSAVRDTEGSGINSGVFSPKTEKGPQYFVEIIKDMKSKYDVEVVLGGWRRQYVKQEFDRYGVRYHSRDSQRVEDIMPFDLLNKYYNACDLVINPALVEGGPMSVPEAAACRVPIISTNTGVASVMLHPNSIYDDPEIPDWEPSLENALREETIEYNFQNVKKYFIKENGAGFKLFDEMIEKIKK